MAGFLEVLSSEIKVNDAVIIMNQCCSSSQGHNLEEIRKAAGDQLTWTQAAPSILDGRLGMGQVEY